MKASIKLRDEESKPPLLRAKVPISIFSLPFATAITAGDPSDLSFHLLTTFPSLPSLKLSYHPNATNPNRNPRNPNPFTLTLKSGAGRLGSPAASPLHISFVLSPNPSNPSFSIAVKPHLGHFSLLKTAASPPPNSNPSPYPKENGGGVHHPIPLGPADRTPLDEVRGGVGVRVRTAVPVGQRAGLKVRWAVKLPSAEGAGSAAVFRRLPYLTLDKISVERVEEEEAAVEVKGSAKEFGEKDFEAMKGMCFWMGREVEELRKESGAIKESVEAVRKKFLEVNATSEGERRKNVSDGGSGGGFSVAGRRA